MSIAFSSYPTGLREITDHLISVFANKAGLKGSFFINDVPGDLPVHSDRQTVTSVLTGVLSALVLNSRDSCIRMSAKVYGQVVLLKVKDSNSSDIDGIETEISKFKPLAEKMRGSVHVTNYRKKLTTVTFGFPLAA